MKNRGLLSAGNLVRGWLGAWGAWLVLRLAGNFVYSGGAVPGHVSQAAFWLGLLLTLPVFVLFCRGKARNVGFNPAWIMYACVAAWCLYLLLIGSAVFMVPSRLSSTLLALSMNIGSLLILPALGVAFLGLGKPPAQLAAAAESKVLTRSVAAVLVLALVVSTGCAVHSLYTAAGHGKFIFNNIANGAGFGAIVFTIVLSYLQRNVYWLGRGPATKLDERELKQRQEVFELSYKIGTALTFAAVYELYHHKEDLRVIINDPTIFSVTPGAMFWPFLNLALALFALPLLVAAARRR